MFKSILRAAAVAAMAMGVILPELSSPVDAMPSGSVGAARLAEFRGEQPSAFTEVHHKWRYRRYHGGNYWPGYGYDGYYNGFGFGGFGLGYGGYYGNPWWGYEDPYYYAPLPVPRYAYGRSHVRWCLNRYRSYNPRTDTFMGYDGHRHYCRSTY